MTTAASERMSRVDTAWLRMDNDVNLMTIVGVWVLEPALDYDALCARLQERLLKYDRFAQTPVQDLTGATWVRDENFDIRRHVVRERLRRRKGESAREALQRRVGELAGTRLDYRHPLWQFHLIEHYDGGSAMIGRLHHCIADGIALIAVTGSLMDGAPEPPHRHDDHDAADMHDVGLTDALRRSMGDLAEQVIDLYSEAVNKGARPAAGASQAGGLAGLPAMPAALVAQIASSGYQLVGDTAALLLMDDDSPTRLKGPLAGRKAVSWSEPLPLDQVKAVGKALGCSINDVLLSCVAGAIGQYLRDQGEDTAGEEIRAMVPVNLRPISKAHDLGNRFGLAPLVLPVGIANPIERLFAVRQRMQDMKGSYQPLLAFVVLAIAGLLVKPLQDALLGFFAKKATAVMTNVPGPQQPLSICGAQIKQNMFWVPASGEIGVGVSILTYAGGVQFGLITDEARCPKPAEIIERFGPEFEKLLLLTLMLPWSGEA